MATATSNQTKPRGSWSAANAHRPAGSPRKWTEEMQQQLVDRVREADKRGTSRQAVYDSLAVEWSRDLPEHYTPHQVSSQFHLAKARFGYDVVKQPQGTRKRRRRVTKPPTRATVPTVLAPIEPLDGVLDFSGIAKMLTSFVGDVIQAVNETLRELGERVEAAEAERDEAVNALEKIKTALK